MKKFICITVVVLLVALIFVGCANKNARSTVKDPLILVNEVEDKYENILQQTYYNERTDEYIIHEYFYELQNDLWVCIGHNTTFYIPEDFNCHRDNRPMKVY